MEEGLNVVDRLWELQNVLSQLAEKEKALLLRPQSFSEVDREFQSANSEMSRLEQRIQDLGKERRRLEGELQDAEQVLKKYQAQLMLVKNQVQYSAAWKEIDTARRRVKELEDAELKVMGDLEEAEGELQTLRQSFDGLKSRFDQEYAVWQTSLGGLRQEIEAIQQKRTGIEEGIPEKVRRQFHRIFQQRQGVAVARIVADSCSGCRVRLVPSAAQQVRRGELVSCEGCGRIIYFEKASS
jgi:predicted  nucleic acid-binding Zn-ribbon protein